jgi:hypothetical protein
VHIQSGTAAADVWLPPRELAKQPSAHDVLIAASAVTHRVSGVSIHGTDRMKALFLKLTQTASSTAPSLVRGFIHGAGIESPSVAMPMWRCHNAGRYLSAGALLYCSRIERHERAAALDALWP